VNRLSLDDYLLKLVFNSPCKKAN